MGKKGNKKKGTTKGNQQNATTPEDIETITEIAIDNVDKSESKEESVTDKIDSKNECDTIVNLEPDETKESAVSEDKFSTISESKMSNDVDQWKEKEADYLREKEMLSLTVCNLQEQLATSILNGKNVQDRLEHAQATMMKTIQRIATLENNIKSLQTENDSLLQENETIQNDYHQQSSNLKEQVRVLSAKVDSLTRELKILRPLARNTHILRDPSDQDSVGTVFPPGHSLIQEYDNVCRLWKGFFDNLSSDDLSKSTLGDAWVEPAYITFLVGGVWDAAVARVNRFFLFHEELLQYNFGVTELADWQDCLPSNDVETTPATPHRSLTNRFMTTSMQRHGLSKLLQEVQAEIKVETLSSNGDLDAANAAETKVVKSVGNAHMLWLHQIVQHQQRGHEDEEDAGNTFRVLNLYMTLVRFLAMCRMSDPAAYLGPRPSSLLTSTGDAIDFRFVSANADIVRTQEQANNLVKATAKKKTIFVNHAKKVDPATPVEVRVLLPGMYFTYSQDVDGSSPDQLVSPSYSFILQGQNSIDRLQKFVDEEAKLQLKRLEEELQGYVYPFGDNAIASVTPVHDNDVNEKDEPLKEAMEDAIVDLHSVNVYASIPENVDEENLENDNEETTEEQNKPSASDNPAEAVAPQNKQEDERKKRRRNQTRQQQRNWACQ